MTNRGRFHEFLQTEFERLFAMSDYKLGEAVSRRSDDDTAYELFQIFLRKQRYELFVMPQGGLATWLGRKEEMTVVDSAERFTEECRKETL